LLLAAAGCRAEGKADASEKPADSSGMCVDEPDAGCGAEWCAEHGVPEAECKICKARGDAPEKH
jgi:hypothetical protein